MNFFEFRNIFFSQKVFSTGDIEKEWAGFNMVNLVNWQKKGYLIKLRNRWYAFPDALKTEADLFFMANRLKTPSCISLETAMRHYNFIPESVFSLTSITTGKPAEWETAVGSFSYRSVQPRLFFGHRAESGFLISDPEKTLLDVLYFNPRLLEPIDFQSLRLNKEEINARLDRARVAGYLAHISSPTLEKRWLGLQKFLET